MRAAAPKIDRFLRRAATFGLLALVVTACAQQSPRVAQRPETAPTQTQTAAPGPRVAPGAPVRVALLAPRSAGSSRDQALAADLEAAARLAVGDARGPGIELSVYDTGADPARAAQAARSAVADGAAVIVGPLFRATTNAVRPVAQGAGVKVLSFSSDSGTGGDPVWVLGDLPENEVERVLGYAGSQGLRSLALVTPRTEYGALVEAEARRSAGRAGLAVVAAAPYERSPGGVERDVSAAAPQILSSGADAALIADGGAALRTVAAFLAFNDVLQPGVRYLGTGQWGTPGTEAEAPLRGGWFAQPDPAALERFAARFREAYGRAPDPLAGLGYDAVAVVDQLAAEARAAGSDRPFTPQAMTARSYQGARGAFRLTQEGANRRALAVMEVTAGGFVPLDPAPAVAPGS